MHSDKPSGRLRRWSFIESSRGRLRVWRVLQVFGNVRLRSGFGSISMCGIGRSSVGVIVLYDGSDKIDLWL